ncbi:MAG: hypothetical protein Q9162_004678 [Coniocarpon cinnabarinum]
MATSRLTPFPTLRSEIQDFDSISGLSEVPAYHGFHRSREQILQAWAQMLRAYSGHQTVYFESDSGPVEVDFEFCDAGTIQCPVDAVDAAQGTISTGVSFGTTVQTAAPSLWLQHDPENRRGILISNSVIPSDHLSELGHQLQIFLSENGDKKPAMNGFPPIAPVQLSISNPQPHRYDTSHHLHQVLENHIGLDRPAVRYLNSQDEEENLSYRALLIRSKELGSAIHRSLGEYELRKEQAIVPIFAPQSPDLYIGELAISYAGAAFCPMSLATPQERIRFVCEDTNAAVILTTKSFAAKLPKLEQRIIIIDDYSSQAKYDSNFSYASAPESLCYVMYTSGSTGKPKGVKVSHAAMMQSLAAHEQQIPPYSSFLQFAAPTFDVSIIEIYLTFARGAVLVCCDRQRLLNDLPGVLNRMEVDAAELTPTVAATLLRNRGKCPSLRHLTTIGEMLTRSVIDEFGSHTDRPGILHAAYGPTEAVVHCTFQGHISSRSIVGNIGRPLPTVSAYILDENKSFLRILPLGQVGELAIGGFQLADGYLNRPHETESAFVDFKGYGKLYRTGDKARLLPDGTLECLGRIGHGQIKLRGQRIELGEIELLVMGHTSTELAVACVFEDRLVLFASSRGAETSVEEITRTCRLWLPSFMMPADVVLIDDFPRLSSGKVDRQRLQSSYDSQSSGVDEHRSRPRDALEQSLSSTLSDFLGHALSPTAKLSSHGIDSLKAIRLASLLSSHKHPVGAVDILSTNSIRNLARRIREQKATSLPLRSPREIEYSSMKSVLREAVREAVLNQRLLNLDGLEEILPCSPIQLAMLTETIAKQNTYCNSITIEFKCSANRIQDMAHKLLETTPMLRSGFVHTGNSKSPFARVVWKKCQPSQIRVVESFSESSESGHALDIVRPFRVEIKDSSMGCTGSFQIHHALYDGWSWDLIVNDMTRILQNVPVGQRPAYDEFVKTVFAYLDSDEALEAESYWKRTLTSFQRSPLPPLTKTVVEQAGNSKICRTSCVDLATIQNVAKMLDVHPQTLFIAALAITLSFYTASKDVSIGLVTAGRTLSLAGIENVTGPCIGTVPLRMAVDKSREVSTLVESLAQQIFDAQRHASFPMSRIKSSVGALPSQALFDVVFVWQQSGADPRDGDWICSLSSIDCVEQNILFEVEPEHSHLQLSTTYKEDAISYPEARDFMAQVDETCQALVSRGLKQTPRELVNRLTIPCLSFSQSPPAAQPCYSLNQMVERWASYDPERVALEYIRLTEDSRPTKDQLTYRDLDQKANLLAHYLRRLGVQPSDVVCNLMDKGLHLFVALVAIAKAGAAFMSIAPETPADRVARALHVTKSRICLVDEEIANCRFMIPGLQIINVNKVDLSSSEKAGISAYFRPDSTAYVVLTSGTTGVPKPVAITQENISTNIESLAQLYASSGGHHDSHSRYLQSCSQAFDVSVFDTFYAWREGMCLVTARKHVLYRDIESFIREHEVTHLSMTPTVAALIDPLRVPQVRMLVTAGEAATETLVQNWADRLFVGYGPAETTNICTVQRCRSRSQRSLLIGPPLPGTSAFVLDIDASGFQILPKGALGELCFGGRQVFKGYLNQDALTEAKILNHPKYGRIYRSGDSGIMLSDGSLMCFGRIDNQVKIRGQRVELGEIDGSLSSSLAVSQSTTIAVTGKDNKPEYLASFWIPDHVRQHQPLHVVALDADVQRKTSDLFGLMLRKLPDYMCPRVLVPINTLPMTSNDKIDRHALLHLLSEMPKGDSTKISRQSEENETCNALPVLDLEKPIRDVLSKLVECSANDIQRNVSFYTYGIDSVAGIALASQLRRRLENDSIDVQTILQHPSVARLAHCLHESPGDAEKGERASSVIDHQTFNALSAEAQQIFGSVEHVFPCTPLQEAFLSANGFATRSAHFNYLEFEISADHERLKRAWAQVVSRQEVEAIFKNEQLPPAPSFRPFLEQAMRQANGESDEYWQSYLRDLEPTMFPDLTGMSPQAPKLSDDTSTTQRIVPLPLDAIFTECQRNCITLLSVCQAAWAKLLETYLGSADVCFGNVMSGRSLPMDGLERLIAPCFNTVPVRVKFKDHATNRELLQSLVDDNAAHLRWQLTPLRRIQAQADCSGHRLFDTLLILQHVNNSLDHSIWSLEEDRGTPSENLAVEADTPVCARSEAATSTSDHQHLLHSAFETNAKFHPHRLAVDFLAPSGPRTCWTFEQLDGFANGIAQALQTHDLAVEDSVVIHLPKSALYYASIIGVLKTGAAFTPFDVDAPEARKKLMEEELHPRVMLVNKDTSAVWSTSCQIDVSALSPNLKFTSQRTVKPTNLAYRLYTSGSTGSPKAVEVEHRNAVQTIVQSREALTRHVVEAWTSLLINSYGPTEAAFCSTVCKMGSKMSSAVIGKPFDWTTFVVLDPAGHVLPAFGLGELYIGGPQVGRGYYNNTSLTRKHFLTHKGQRFYKTGDLVRSLSDGSFQFVGRVDDQIKIHGLRVELGEINNVIRTCDSRIADVSTQFFKPCQGAGSQLVSFIVGSVQSDKQEITDAADSGCRRQLPAYMVPSSFVSIDRIPLSAAGKVDKKQLTAIMKTQKAPARLTWAHQTLTGHQRIIAEVLALVSKFDVHEIGLDTNIYQLGLDSISAVIVSIELGKQSVDVEPTSILQNPTLSGISSVASFDRKPRDEQAFGSSFDFGHFQSQHISQICGNLDIKRSSVASLRPCTPFQRAALAQFVISEGKSYYNYITLSLKETRLASEIEEAFNFLIERHEMLRTGFVSIEDPDYSFAMLTYRARAVSLPVVLDANVDVRRWRKSAKDHFYQHLHEPAWQVLIQNTPEKCIVHWGMHHAVFDAKSLDIILNDLHAVLNGDHLRPVEDTIDPTLSDILAGSKRVEEAEKFWRALEGQVTAHAFPDLAPLHNESHDPIVLEELSSASVLALQASCRHQQTTLPTATQAAWARILSAYTDNQIVCFGNVMAGRSTSTANNAVLPCVTTAPVVADCSKSNSELLQSLMSFSRGSSAYQFVPLNKIQRWLGLGESAPFNTLFTFQKHVGDPDERMFELVDSKASVEYRLSLEVELVSVDKLAFRLVFPPSLIPKPHARIILKQIDMYLKNILQVDDQGAKPSSASLLSVSPASQPRISSEVRLLHELFERTVARSPKKVAFEFVSAVTPSAVKRESWTYKEIDYEGNKVANFLIHRHIAQRSLVATCFNKCVEAPFAILGILKVGCGFVAIDHAAPRARKAFIVRDSGAAALLTTSDIAPSFGNDLPCPVIAMDEMNISGISDHQPQLPHEVQSQDTAYCLYTSGSTGVPKGCNLSHDNVVQAMMAFRRLFRWSDNSRWLQFAGYHFDVSVLEFFWSWSVGITVVSIPRDILFEDLGGIIGRLGITHVDLTPALAQTIDPQDIPTLCTDESVFITGGEALKDDIIARWGPHETIHNGYGPTEVTIGCTMFPRVPTAGKVSNIGWQFDNVGALVLMPGTREPVLRGAPGELCVYGPLVAKGYLNRPEKTAESFQDIEIDGKTERMYRTGDLVRSLHDNSFAFVGRVDDQVKLRGQRIETREINKVVQSSDENIADVVTVKHKHRHQQKEQLVTFFCLKKSAKQDNQIPSTISGNAGKRIELAKNRCLEFLPEFAVPTHFILMTSFPLSANNKVDVRRLRDSFDETSLEDLHQLASPNSQSTQVLTHIESEIANILCEYLGGMTFPVQRSTSVFELGLDSISVLGFSRKLKKACFSKATPALILKAITIEALAAALSDTTQLDTDGGVRTAEQQIAACDHRFRNMAARVLCRKASDIECIAPCTSLQQGMISRAVDSDRPIYFTDLRFKLRQRIDVERLHEAWSSVVKQTQILRTRFIETEIGHVQVALKQSILPWTVLDRANEEPCHRMLDGSYDEWWTNNRITLASPLEVVLCQDDSNIVMALHIFHGLYDGSSLPMILDVVSKVYDGHGFNTGPPFQSLLSHGPLRILNNTQEFWLDHLQSLRQCEPMKSMVSAPKHADKLVSRPIHIPQGLEEIRTPLKATSQALIQAAWLATLTHFFGAVPVGVVVSGRHIDHEEADRAIGPLFNTIPLCIVIHESTSWSSLVAQCHSFNTAALPYQHTALRDITKWTRAAGLTSARALFDNILVLQNADDVEASDNHVWEPLASDVVHADYPLALEVEYSTTHSCQASMSAQASFAGESELNDLLDTFEGALRLLATNPSHTIAQNFRVPQLREETPVIDADSGNTEHTSKTDPSADDAFEWTDLESELREQIASASGLPLKAVTPHTSILELGLDSVDAVKLSSSLRRQSGIQISQSQILQSLTIAKMAEHISTSNEESSDTKVVADSLAKRSMELKEALNSQDVRLSDIDEVLPATPLQEALVAEMYSSNFETYYNHEVLEMLPEVDVDRLKRAWQAVIDRNQILRSSFIPLEDSSTGATFAQLIHPIRPIAWKLESSESLHFNLSTLLEKATDEARMAGHGVPPLRLTLVKSSDSGSITHLVLSISHALYDGWSIGLLHHDVQAAYMNRLPERPDFRPVLAEIIDSATDNKAHEFWQDTLSGLSPTLLSESDLKASSGVHRAERHSKLSATRLSAFCKSRNVSMSTLTQTVFALGLATLAQKVDVAFGVVLSGRNSEESQEIMFPAMNTIVCRSILHGTRVEMVRYVSDTMDQIRTYERYPLRKALSVVQRTKGTSRLFDTLFLFQRGSKDNVGNEEQPLYKSISGASQTEHSLAVEAEVVGDSLVWRNACQNNVFDEEETEKILQTLDGILGSIVSGPDTQCLTFSGSRVSVCELPPFNPTQEALQAEPGSKDDVPSQDKEPDALMTSAIRSTLADVAATDADQVSQSSTVFSLGLDSISAIKVQGMLRKRNIHLTVKDMLKAGSLAQMAHVAQCIDSGDAVDRGLELHEESSADIIKYALEGLDSRDALSTLALQADDVEMVAPASAGQTYMLCMQSEYGLFHPSFDYSLSMPQNTDTEAVLDRLTRAWDKVVASTPILRTLFVATENDRVPFLQVTLNSHSAAAFSATHYNGRSADSEGFVQIGTRTPLVQLLAATLSNQQQLKLKMHIHHALYDGVSLPLIIQRLESLVRNSATVLTPSAQEQSTAWSIYIATSLTPSAQQKRREFWQNYLGETVSSSILPDSRVQSSSQHQRAEIFDPAILSQAQTTSLTNIARRNHLTIQALFLASYAHIYASLTSKSSSNIIIGIYLANRSLLSSTDLSSHPFPTLNLLPLRVRLHVPIDLVKTARQIQEDIQTITSDPAIATSSLHEICDLTNGVVVDTFVNFLSLPSEASLQPDENAVLDRLTVQDAGSGRETAYAHIVEAPTPPDDSLLTRQNPIPERVRRVCQRALDIEAAVTEKGELAMGVFCNESLLDLEGCQNVMGEVREMLGEMLEKMQ